MQLKQNSEVSTLLNTTSNTSDHSNSVNTTNTNKSDTHFSDYLGSSSESSENINSVVSEEEKTQKLVDDLLSVLRTGLTVEELERLEELLAEIKKLLKEKSEEGISAEAKQEISSMLSQLEEELLSLQKRLSGVSIIEAEDEKQKNQNSTTQNPQTAQLELKIDALEETISELKQGKNKFNEDLFELLDIQLSSNDLQKSISQSDIQMMREEYKKSFTDEKFEKILEVLNLEDLSADEKELYKSIIADRYISDEEVDNLTYEQAKILGKFVFVKEPNSDRYIDETLINVSFKPGTLLSIPLIGDDETFKKTLYEMVHNMNNQEDLRALMAPLTGTSHFNKIIAFPELLQNSYNGKDMEKVLEEFIEQFNFGLDNSIKSEQYEYYKNQIARFTDLFNLYSEKKGQSENKLEKEQYVTNLKQELIDDLLSMLKTGLTKSEIEDLEKLVHKIDKLIEESKKKEVSEEKIVKMLDKLKEDLDELYRRLGSKGEIEVDTKNTNADPELNNKMNKLNSILSSLKQALEDLKSGDIEENLKNKDKTKADHFISSTHAEMLLREKLKALKN